MYGMCCTKSFLARLFATRQAPLSTGFSRQEYWSGLPCPPPEALPHSGTEHASPAAAACKQILYHWASREAPLYMKSTLLRKTSSVCSHCLPPPKSKLHNMPFKAFHNPAVSALSPNMYPFMYLRSKKFHAILHSQNTTLSCLYF